MRFPKLSVRTVFLLDGLGAAVSVVVSGVVLPIYADALGLAPQVFHGFAALAFAFMLWSLGCRFLVRQIKGWMLQVIMAANTFYCLLSGAVLMLHADITSLGRAVLLAEIIVVLSVVTVEMNVYLENFKRINRSR
jgi:hypothetical protein